MKQILAVAAAAVIGSTAWAVPVQVEITGEVIFNGIGSPPLSNVSFGDVAVMSFLVDSDNFVDGVPGDTRGYPIVQPSFSLSFDGEVTVGLLDPYTVGATPYFGIVDGFPVSDGFFVSESPFSEGGVALEQEPYNAGFGVGYTGDTLSSLDILDAVGTYDFNGLTRFGYGIWSVFPDNVNLGMDFVQMTITVVPAPASLAVFAPLALGVRRRRRA